MIFSSVLATALLVSVAFAYYTSTGTGSGSATVTDVSPTLSITGTPAGQLTPGGSTTVNFTVDNPQSYSVRIGTISDSLITTAAGCTSSWFSMTDAVANQVIAANGNDVAITATATLSMTDEAAANQDACQGTSPSLTLTSN